MTPVQSGRSTILIIRKEANGLLFIRQPDHAAAAADMMAAWRLDGLPSNPRRDSILSAVRSHDDGWIEEDDETIVAEDGTAVDFIAVPFEGTQRVWPRCVDRLGGYQPYVAALVAQHSLTIFKDSRTKPEWQPYFAAQTARRDALLARCAPQIASQLDEDYRFLRMADLMSLVFCNGWLDPLDYGGHSFVLRGNTLTVTPDPFAGARVDLHIPAKRLPARAYTSSAELREALAAAPEEIVTGAAIGG